VKNKKINVMVPTSTTAVVGIPSKEVEQTKRNVKLVWKDGKYYRDIIAPRLNRWEDRIRFEVSSGNWQFVAEF
jgi:hypothetical protein